MQRIFNPSDLANFLDKPEKSILKDLGLISEQEYAEDEFQPSHNSISFFCLNVCGIINKFGFISEDILKNYILVFTETKTDATCNNSIENFFSAQNYFCIFKHKNTQKAQK